MKSSELRIGNLVQDEHGIVQYVYRLWKDGAELASDMDGSEDLDYNEDEMFGIPLTVGWLVELGYLLIHSDITTYYKPGWIICVDSDNKFYVVLGRKIILDYVHQIQNLYFDIEREELTVKL